MIYIVGIGPGNKKYLTLNAIETVESSDIVAGSRRALELFDIKEDKKYILTKNLVEELKDLVINNKNKTITLLSTGDPCFSGLLKTVLKYDIAKKEDIKVIPGISSIQVVASRLKISWEDYHVLTLHGKEENRKILLNLIKNNKKVIFLPNNLKEDIEYLLNNGINPNKKITVCENLTYKNERIIYEELNNIAHMNFSYLCVCVVE
ncbi:cobalt-precorrin-7 (C(5))-methyltransferase [Methanothermococcus okinawensis]|uniref:Precorrin-6y C5,15-methyltransferase (Decarboxylating), CbiE subunit n=1 Tax=Methanothermococcus okinawensis (strain DSM 14208 / JCM 11175 / IH1) TaxID=647113 RepID=F8ANI3_METOI|nr:cobalt-precorrin-7 (C(5))-methyltransferase [Methanothermococcus okinawensis]AEH07037.1 precorrin-6y C5,15-methyltransferase (decarboxylating), CbiE subunit [Methanothermococcus okinawensis IH1]